MDQDAAPSFAVTALRYPTNSAASAAYELVMAGFRGGDCAGDSLYRFTLGDAPVVAVLTWSATPARLAAIAALPHGTTANRSCCRQPFASSSLAAAS